MSVPFLLEIGTEEIPDWMIAGALEDLKRLFLDVVPGVDVNVAGTPRRLVLWSSAAAPSVSPTVKS